MAEIPGFLELTPLNPAYTDDPHAVLDRLRSACPVHRDETAGTFILTRYADVRGVVSDTSMWRSPQLAEQAAIVQRALADQVIPGVNVPEDENRKSILLMDDPDHARIRQPLARALYKRVQKCRPLVEDVVREAEALAAQNGVR